MPEKHALDGDHSKPGAREAVAVDDPETDPRKRSLRQAKWDPLLHIKVKCTIGIHMSVKKRS